MMIMVSWFLCHGLQKVLRHLLGGQQPLLAEPTMGRPDVFWGRADGKPWENHGKSMGKPWKNGGLVDITMNNGDLPTNKFDLPMI